MRQQRLELQQVHDENDDVPIFMRPPNALNLEKRLVLRVEARARHEIPRRDNLGEDLNRHHRLEILDGSRLDDAQENHIQKDQRQPPTTHKHQHAFIFLFKRRHLHQAHAREHRHRAELTKTVHATRPQNRVRGEAPRNPDEIHRQRHVVPERGLPRHHVQARRPQVRQHRALHEQRRAFRHALKVSQPSSGQRRDDAREVHPSSHQRSYLRP